MQRIGPVHSNVIEMSGSTQQSPSVFGAYVIAQAAMKKITPEEWQRRDNIIRVEANSVTYTKNASVYPHTWANFVKYGQCKIIGITDTYKDFTELEWPANDVPYVIVARSFVKDMGTLTTTAGFFTTKPPIQST